MRREAYDKIAQRHLPPGYDLKKLRQMQTLLASRVEEKDYVDENARKICGLDLAYVRQGQEELGIASAVLYDAQEDKILEKRYVITRVDFPYIPTLLSLRELRPMIMALKRLSENPDVILVDGHGKAHPYRLGIAAHLGVVIKRPTIGVAKSLLYGKVVCNENEDVCNIVDEETGEIIGKAIRHHGKYVYVSVGNMITLDTAVKIVKKLLKTTSQMPLPILHAHRLCNELKKKVKAEKSSTIFDFLK